MLADYTDSLGGGGSLMDSLQSIATNGLSRAIDGYLSKEYPLTSFNENQAVDAYGNPLPVGAPQTAISSATTFSQILKQPVVLGVLGAVALTVVVLVVARR